MIKILSSYILCLMYRRTYCGLQPSHAPSRGDHRAERREKNQNEIHSIRSGHESEGPEDQLHLSLSLSLRTTAHHSRAGRGWVGRNTWRRVTSQFISRRSKQQKQKPGQQQHRRWQQPALAPGAEAGAAGSCDRAWASSDARWPRCALRERGSARRASWRSAAPASFSVSQPRRPSYACVRAFKKNIIFSRFINEAQRTARVRAVPRPTRRARCS